MATQTPSLVRRTFRITVDVETIITAEPRETLSNGPEDEHYHQALVQHLLAHPPVLSSGAASPPALFSRGSTSASEEAA